jgi:pimeloyl-ACP methyl ester carboxylesterase
VTYLDRDDGARIHYQTFGPENGGKGATPLLLTHGFSASSAMWEPNVAALSAARPLITWDVRGHGTSDAGDDLARYSAEASVADMAALLDACGIGRAVIGGLSLGGFLSLRFFLSHPDRVAGLVLCDTGPGYRRDEARQQWNGQAIAFAERLERDSKPGMARAARGILTQHDALVIDALPTITVPALVLVGAQDKDYLGAAQYMAAKATSTSRTCSTGRCSPSWTSPISGKHPRLG